MELATVLVSGTWWVSGGLCWGTWVLFSRTRPEISVKNRSMVFVHGIQKVSYESALIRIRTNGRWDYFVEIS